MKNETGRPAPGSLQPNCPLCAGEARPLWVLEHTGVWRCGDLRCALEFAHPQLDDRALAQAYASLYYPAEDGGKLHLENTPEPDIRIFFRAVASHLGPVSGKRILDYGCGNGGLLRVASELGAHATGIEQSEVARESIQRRGFGRAFRDLAALQAAEPAARFDWIVLCEVIEHLRWPWEELEAFAPLLSPDGHIVVTTPNAACLKSRLRGAAWEQRQNLTHFYYFNPTSLGACLRRAGLRDVRELPAIVDYSGHGATRRLLQHALRACRLQGGLLFTGAAPSPGGFGLCDPKRPKGRPSAPRSSVVG